MFNLVDARPKADVEASCIKGTINIPFSEMFDVSEDGIKTLKTVDKRREIFKANSVTPDGADSKELVVMCRSGVTAAVVLCGLADLYCELGFEKLSLYDGSWTEYAASK